MHPSQIRASLDMMLQNEYSIMRNNARVISLGGVKPSTLATAFNVSEEELMLLGMGGSGAPPRINLQGEPIQ